MNTKISQIIKKRLQENNINFRAIDNISPFIHPGEIDQLIDECSEIFEKLLETLIIDLNDDNSKDTPKRLSKMFIQELFRGRYYDLDNLKSFPVTNNYLNTNNIFLIKHQFVSTCAHHFLPIKGIIYIGIIFNKDDKVLGLSKYYRICDWCCKRGVLQEELILLIYNELNKLINNDNIAIYIKANHDCCQNRGIKCDDFLITNIYMSGIFETNNNLKETFMNLIKLDKNN